MIKGFEKYTEELDAYEIDQLLPIILKGLSFHKGKDNAVTNRKMELGLKQRGYKKVSGARIRKIINYIRINHLIEGLISSSKGYWISEDPEEIREYRKSLGQRVASIYAVYQSFNKYE